MRKKVVAMMMAAALVVSTAACGSSGSSKSESNTGSQAAATSEVANKDKPLVWFNRQPSNSSTGELDKTALNFNKDTYYVGFDANQGAELQGQMVLDYIKENAEVHQFAAEVARIISGIPQMPEFSSENMTVADASQLIGLPITAIRAGIVYGWLPIGVAVQNNKPAKNLSGGRITYIISPRKVYEVTGHVWKGKEALNK